MVARWIAAVMLLTTLVIAGIFVWAIFNPPPDSAAGSAGAPASATARFDSAGRPRILHAEVVPRSADTIAVTVSITDAELRPVTASSKPTAVLTMVTMAMGSDRVDLAPDGPGVWRGTGSLSMAGRWSLRVDLEGERLDVPFETTSR